MGRPRGLPLFFFNDTATSEIYTLSLHDALPISSHIDTAKGNLVVDDPTIWFNEPLFKERSRVKIHSGLGVLNWLAIVPDEPTGRKDLPLDSPTSQGPCAFVVNPLLVTQLVLGGIVHSSLACLTPTSYLSVAYGGSLQCSYPSAPTSTCNRPYTSSRTHGTSLPCCCP